MKEHIDKCKDPRGTAYLKEIFMALDELLVYKGRKGCEAFESFLKNMDLNQDLRIDSDTIKSLTDSVNEERLANNPVGLRREDIAEIYGRIG